SKLQVNPLQTLIPTPPPLPQATPPFLTPPVIPSTQLPTRRPISWRPFVLVGGGCVAFLVVILIVAFSFSGGGFTGRARIESVFRADRSLTKQIASQAGLLDKYWNSSEIVGRYVQGLRAIDL